MSRVARRIVLALMLAALLPLGAAVVLALMLTEVSLGVGLNETVRRGLANDIPLYRTLFDAKKALYQVSTESLARDPLLLDAVMRGDAVEVQRRLDRALVERMDLTRLELSCPVGEFTARRPAEPGGRPLTLKQALAGAEASTLTAEFQLQRRYVHGLEEARNLAETYQTLSAARENITRSLLLSFAAVLLVVLFGSVLAGLLLARGVTKRVAHLAAATAQVADGDLSVRVDARGRDEIAELGNAFNSMVAELEEGRDRIVYLEKISGWQEVARRLAHEIKNPLTPIVLAMQQLDEKKPVDDEGYARLVGTAREIIEEEVASLRHLVEEFSAFAKLPQVRPEPVDLSQYLEELCGHVAATTPGAVVEVEIEADLGEAQVDRMMMRRVLVNLVSNAVEAQAGASETPRVRVTGIRRDAARVIAVEDDGPGVDPDVRARLFEPYVTTKEHGTGLGLAIVKKIVLQHGGSISAGAAISLGGARLEVRLPTTAPGATPGGRGKTG